MTLPPKAQKGQSVRAAWDALTKWAKRARLRHGPGVRLAHTDNGTIISFVPAVTAFRGKFAVRIEGDSVTVGIGTVEGVEPTIGGTPITGGKDGVIPKLKLSGGKYNEDGKSWICVRVTVPEKGMFSSKIKDAATIIQSSHPYNLLPRVEGAAIAPLAMLRRKDPKRDDFGDLYQIAYFDLRIYRDNQGVGKRRIILAP